MTEEEKLERRKDFRKYLRTKLVVTGSDLSALMNAADVHVPTLVQELFLPEFSSLYEDRLNLRELMTLVQQLERDEHALVQRQGYACLRAIQGYASYFADRNGLNVDDYRPDEIDFHLPDEELSFHEGREYEVRGMRFERDHKARNQCIEYYKRLNNGQCRCQVCGMSFEEVYGDVGKDVIEVHHIVPISERGGEYVLNPIRDLVPLCSNCHTMVHKTNLSIEELKDAIHRAMVQRT